jgi:hypothetical protein
MPLVLFNNKWEIRCVNHESHKDAGATTMQAAAGWYALTRVTPPPAVAFNPANGIPVSCSICRVCGYVELYAGSIVDPKTWRPGG